ncbi:MAG: hypothetical protein U0637_09990 [Phycisphaerales bacterium]
MAQSARDSRMINFNKGTKSIVVWSTVLLIAFGAIWAWVTHYRLSRRSRIERSFVSLCVDVAKLRYDSGSKAIFNNISDAISGFEYRPYVTDKQPDSSEPYVMCEVFVLDGRYEYLFSQHGIGRSVFVGGEHQSQVWNSKMDGLRGYGGKLTERYFVVCHK